jgi:hypothetical protein
MSEIKNFNAVLCGHVFAPFSSVICCFVSDLGGPEAVANWLAEQATSPRTSDLPTVPRVLLVIMTRSNTFDERIAANEAALLLQKAMQRLKHYNVVSDTKDEIQSHFASIEVLGLQSSLSTSSQARRLRTRLLAMSKAAMQERANMHTQFSYLHFQTLSKQLLDHVSSRVFSPFHFADVSRAHGFSTDYLQSCLTDFLAQLPSQAWLWHFAAPIIASALLLSSYPPQSHSTFIITTYAARLLTYRADFSPEYLFTALYAKHCRLAINSYTGQEGIQTKFMSSLLHEFISIFTQFDSGVCSASQIHQEVLSTHSPHIAELKSHRSCFSCFMRMPEKVLACGHALCDSCIKIFGTRSPLEKNTFELLECVLCGVSYQNATFRFVPPTAGIRVLSVDGGGIRGVIPLVFLQHLERSMPFLGCTIKDHFDYACGTSAGKKFRVSQHKR